MTPEEVANLTNIVGWVIIIFMMSLLFSFFIFVYLDTKRR